MFLVTRELHFCFGHRLMDYAGKCNQLHGHNGKAVVTLRGAALDARGMVFDFVDIKRGLQTWIDKTLDHKMILHRADPLAELLRSAGDPVYVLDVNPTTENLAKHIYEQAAALGFPVYDVTMWETDYSYATYRADE